MLETQYGATDGASAACHSAGSVAGEALIVTLADVLARLEANPSRDRRHVEMKSAIRCMGEVLRRPNLIDIPADPAPLRKLIAAASPASVGMTKARWSRIKSLTLAALRDLGIDMMPGRDIGGSSPAWKELVRKLPPKPSLGFGLSRFASYCTRREIEPPDVTASTFIDFHGALKAKSLKAKPEAIYRQTVRYWNKAVDSLDGWPQTHIPLERHGRFYSLPWEDFPPSLGDDVEAFLESSANHDVFDVFDAGYTSPVKASTVALHRRQLRQLLSVLVASGFPIDQITSLAVLVEPANAIAALRFQRERQGSVYTTSLSQQAWLLCTIARRWVKVEAHLIELKVLARRIDKKRNPNGKPKGLTERNRARLRQFDLKANRDALLHLPATILERARRENAEDITEAYRASLARSVLLATAVEILIVAPIRVGNLTDLEHARHFIELGRGRSRNRHLIIPAKETKTGEPFEMILPAGTAAMLDMYLKTYRPRICTMPSDYLFPNPDGGRRGTIPFSKAISAFIEKETGIRMHVHLFRHLAGKFHLGLHPNDLETVRRVLGHKSLAITERHYTGLRTGQAFENYDNTVASLRAPPARPGSNPRSRGPQGGKS